MKKSSGLLRNMISKNKQYYSYYTVWYYDFMNEKNELYNAIKVFADGDEDVYNCLKKDIYVLTHTDDPFKFRRTVALILFFTNHDKNILDAINSYINFKNIDEPITL